MNQSEEDKQQSKLELKVRTFTGIIRESKKIFYIEICIIICYYKL